jgi:hypothetical protein
MQVVESNGQSTLPTLYPLISTVILALMAVIHSDELSATAMKADKPQA